VLGSSADCEAPARAWGLAEGATEGRKEGGERGDASPACLTPRSALERAPEGLAWQRGVGHPDTSG